MRLTCTAERPGFAFGLTNVLLKCAMLRMMQTRGLRGASAHLSASTNCLGLSVTCWSRHVRAASAWMRTCCGSASYDTCSTGKRRDVCATLK